MSDNLSILPDFVCIDLETTGLSFKEDKIIEIGAARFENGREAGHFQSFVNPGILLTKKTREITGITDMDLADAPSVRQILPGFLEFSKGLPLLGHNILFDYSFLKKNAMTLGISWNPSGIDTLSLSRLLLPDLPSRKLPDLCIHYSILHHAHRALADALAAAAVYYKLAEDFMTEDNMDLFQPKPLLKRIKKDPPASPHQLELITQLIHSASLISPEIPGDLKSLTRSEASRLYDRIRSGQIRSE